MRRYKFLRAMGCDPLTAAFVAILNSAFDIPSNEIRFLSLTIEMKETP